MSDHHDNIENYSTPPTSKPLSPRETVEAMVALFGAMAEAATDIAHSKRVMYQAYLAEGFNEQQAMELIKGTGL